MKSVYFFPSSNRGIKRTIFFSCALVLACTVFGVIYVGYESCIVLYGQTRHVYSKPKRVIAAVSEKEIADIRQRIGAKLQEKRKYEKIADHANRLFDYYTAIRRTLTGATLTHCSLSFLVIMLTIECTHRDEIDHVLEQLQKAEQFESVKLRSSEKTTQGIYVHTIVITPKQDNRQHKKAK